MTDQLDLGISALTRVERNECRSCGCNEDDHMIEDGELFIELWCVCDIIDLEPEVVWTVVWTN